MKTNQLEKNKKASCGSTSSNWHAMNHKQRREMMRKIQSEDLSLEIVHRDAAGIDIGNESHYVAAPPTPDSQPVRRFGCTTSELKDTAVWLRQCAIHTVTLQSTGVCWIAVYDILEQAGFEVYLVNANQTKNLPGRKRCAGEPMADEAAHLWSVAELVSALSRNPQNADLLAAAQ